VLIRLKKKGQVAIPSAIWNEIGAREGDAFEVAVSDGVIVLQPQSAISHSAPTDGPRGRAGVDITRWIGSGKGLFQTPEEVDAFLRKERAAWK